MDESTRASGVSSTYGEKCSWRMSRSQTKHAETLHRTAQGEHRVSRAVQVAKTRRGRQSRCRKAVAGSTHRTAVVMLSAEAGAP